MTESEREWRDIPGETNYEVSNDGLVRRKALILKPWALPQGHLHITVSNGKRLLVHRAVAFAFIENPESKRCVNHKNGNPGDNRLENLEWATHGENLAHGYRSNGRAHYRTYPIVAIDADGEIVEEFANAQAAATRHGVTRGAIHVALRSGGRCRGYYWKKA